MVRPTNTMHTMGPQLPLTATMPNLDYKALSKVCSMGEQAIARKYGLKYVHTADGGYWFKDNKANILAVAHLDSQMPYTHFAVARMRHDTKIFCPTLDDRLGAYMLLEYLPKAGVEYDILLTTNEEKGRSTARFFRTDKQYKWMFMFDRMGTGSVVYNYDDRYKREKEIGWSLALEDAGLYPSYGSYSCIKDLEFLGCKGVNVGVGYHNNHDIEAFASRNELMKQIQHFLTFYEENANIFYPHVYVSPNAVHTYPVQAKRSENKVTQVQLLSRKLEKKKLKEKETKEDTTLSLRATQNIGSEDSGAWKAKRAILQQDITILNVSDRIAEKLKQAQVFYVGELARKSRTEIIALDGLTKDDLNAILEALALVGLSTCTQLSNYGLIYYQGMIGEVINTLEEKSKEKKVVEEPSKIATALVTPVTPHTTTLDGATVDYVPPPLGTGTIEYSIPLLKGDDAQLFRNVNGEVVWTHPLPKELVGFQSSRSKKDLKEIQV